MDVYQKALELHRKHQGKITVEAKVPVRNKDDLSLAYSPGVAEPCRAIATDPEAAYRYTTKGNMVAVVSDGTAVLGLGNIGAQASLPVMEGKALLFKAFAGVDAFPICLDAETEDEVVAHVKALAPTFGGINLEDIAGPRCFAIEERLKDELDIPVFHDDQHGTAVVMFAGLLNALKVVGKDLTSVKTVILGAGAAGVAIAKLLNSAGMRDIIVCDRHGAIAQGMERLDDAKTKLASYTNPDKIEGSLSEIIAGADVFIGVAGPNTVSEAMVESMASDAIVFALANPEPEIYPEAAQRAGAAVTATGRSDYANQINNVLGFPGIFRGALDVRASDITEGMKLAAAHAIADLVTDDELRSDYIIPAPFDARVAPNVAAAVAQAAIDDEVARRDVDPEWVRKHCYDTAQLQPSK